MDQGYTLAVIQAGFDFGDLLIQAGIVAVAGLWVCLPFSLFGVRRRLDTINEAQREHAEALAVELRRFRTLSTARMASSAPRDGKSETRDATADRSEERRGGKECLSTCKSRWATEH